MRRLPACPDAKRTTCRGYSARPEDHLGQGEDGDLFVVAGDSHQPDLGAAADVLGLGAGDQLVALDSRREDVQLQLDRGEVVAVGEVAEGAPGSDRVRERGPDPAVDEAAWVQVTVVDDDAAGGVIVLDFERLDTQVARKAAVEDAADGESTVILLSRRGMAAPG